MSQAEATTQRDVARPSAISTIGSWGNQLQRLPLHVVIIIFAAFWLIPTIGLIVNSFRSVADMQSSGWWTTLLPPHGFTFASYKEVLNTEGVPQSIVNSVL